METQTETETDRRAGRQADTDRLAVKGCSRWRSQVSGHARALLRELFFCFKLGRLLHLCRVPFFGLAMGFQTSVQTE